MKPTTAQPSIQTGWPLFASDNHFEKADRTYTPAERWDILAGLGFDQAYLGINLDEDESWSKLTSCSAEIARTGLGLIAAYTVLDIDLASPRMGRTPIDVIDLLPDGGTLDLAIRASQSDRRSDPSLDPRIHAALMPLLDRARGRNITVSLYHHIWFLVERIEDALRLADQIDDPSLKVTFSGFHWYAVDSANLSAKLKSASHRLHLVSICGAHPREPGRDYPLPAVIEPVGDGDYPLEETIRILRSIGYRGAIGFLGYGIGGHPPAVLARSLNAFRRAASSQTAYPGTEPNSTP